VTWKRVGRLAELPAGRGVRIDAPGHRVALFRIEESVYAIGDRCSHAEASLAEGPLFDLAVECPRHGSEFDLATGDPSGLPATKPVPTYETRVDDGVVYLDLPEDTP
jgi:3-phenylpropionate/trans-cinnamate dioxygenase ferredoxin subunit